MKIIDATLGHWLCWILGYVEYFSNKPAGTCRNTQPGRILVIRPGGMGDMILLVPVLKHLAQSFPSAQIDIICEKRNIEVLRMAGLEKNAIAYDSGLFRIMRLIRNRIYDIAIDTEQFHNSSAIMAFLSRAPVRIGFKINPHRNLLYTHLVNYSLDGYEGDQFARLIQALGISDFSYKLENSIPAREISLPPVKQEKLARLRQAGKLVTVHCGSSSLYKQWDIRKFIALIRALVTEHSCSVALAGSNADIALSAAVLHETRDIEGRVFSFAGELTLEETSELIRQSALFVSGDSGLAHLAIAIGTPTVVIFGPTDPGKWGFQDACHKIAIKPVKCSPCFIFGYHKLCRSMECMAGITEKDVLTMCNDCLKR